MQVFVEQCLGIGHDWKVVGEWKKRMMVMADKMPAASLSRRIRDAWTRKSWAGSLKME